MVGYWILMGAINKGRTTGDCWDRTCGPATTRSFISDPGEGLHAVVKT